MTRNVWMVIASAGALCAALWLAGPASAETLANCQREYAAKKAAGETNGEREKKFVAACRARRATTAGSLSETKTGDGPPRRPIDEDEISRETENPVTRWITLPLRYEPEFDDGPYNLTKETFELDQAVAPFKLNDDWALITRTKLPLVVQPPKSAGADWETGLNNGYTTFFLSPERGQGFYWGVGPVLDYPATNTAIGVNKWGSGPSFAFIVKDESPLAFGLVVNNIWSSGGGPNSDRTNQMLLNPIVSYHLGHGWAISSSPDITANWIASGGKWTVPVGGGISKVIEVGGQSIKLALEAYYNAIRPKADQETWLMQVTLTFVFPK